MDRLYYVTATFPAGTPISAPVSIPWSLEDNDLIYVDINIPPGPSAQMGFRLLWAGQQIIPWGNNSFLVTDDEKIHVDVNSYMTQTGLVIEGYNVDIFPHTIYIRGLIRTATAQEVVTANELTGNIGLPASLDTTEVNQGNSLTASDLGLSDDQLTADQGIGADSTIPDIVNVIPLDETVAATMITAPIGTSPVSSATAPTGIQVIKVIKKPKPIAHHMKPNPLIKVK